MPNIPFPTDFPFSVQGVRNEFDRLLDRVWHLGLSTAPLDGQDWAPCVDLFEEPDRYIIRAELPGVGAEEVHLEILGNMLTIRGCKAVQKDATGDRKPLRGECRYGSFHRKVELPGGVKEDGIVANCRNGVLEISVPKKPEVHGRTVKVQPGQ